jgi:Fe-S cluster assembly protein SufD
MKNLFPILDELKKETETTKPFSDNTVLTALQSKAADQYDRLPLPNPSDKSWSKLAEMQLPDITYRLAQEPLITHNQSIMGREKCSGRIEIHEDALDFQLDKNAAEAGVILCDLVSASRDHAQLLEKSLAQLAQTKPARIAEFTTALSRHGFLLYIPGGYRSDLPIEIVTSLKNDGLILPILALVILEEGAQIALISRQESTGPEGKAAISLMNWMIQIGDKAELRFL